MSAARQLASDGQKLGHIRFRAAGLAFIEQLGRPLDHQRGGLHFDIGARDRKLNALVLADRPAEDFPLLGVGGCAFDEEAPVADAFGGDQYPLGVHPVEDVAKSTALLANQICDGHRHVVEEKFSRGVIEHRANRADRQAVFHGVAEVDDQHGDAVGRPGAPLPRRGAAEQHHEVRMFGATDPYFLAVDDVADRRRAARTFACGWCRCRLSAR